jgi:hypothetical protein
MGISRGVNLLSATGTFSQQLVKTISPLLPTALGNVPQVRAIRAKVVLNLKIQNFRGNCRVSSMKIRVGLPYATMTGGGD